jgi:hypothetical protein
MSIWDKVDQIRKNGVEKKAKEKAERTPLQKELSDEIKTLRERNKIFAATNESDTYLVLCFSCKDDKELFLRNLQLKKNEHTYLDGYEVGEKFDIEPKKPKFKLPNPLNKK